MRSTTSTRPRPFRIPTEPSPWRRGLARPLERILSLRSLERIYEDIGQAPDGVTFATRAIERLGITLEEDASSGAVIPVKGPAIVAANHPFGGIEGLILARVLGALRPDVKILANRLLTRIPELAPMILPVDVFGGEAARAQNARAFRAAIEHLAQGGLIAIFPAGEVSRVSISARGVIDKPWGPSVARMALRGNAPIVPLRFEGRNGNVFQILGLVAPRLSTALLPRELLNKRGATIRYSVGTSVRPEELRCLEDDEARADFVRLRTSALASRGRGKSRDARHGVALAPRAEAGLLRRELDQLPPERTLASAGDLLVLRARAHEIPNTFHEIGVLRELTFRAVGEGTGRALDVDRFDRDYHHLILWDRRAERIAGAYRMGATDEIVPRRGFEGLYTSTLFDWDARARAALGDALELGRSFVVSDYQRSYAPLSCLWKGIGAYVAANPRYRRVFGPVSVSADYSTTSRQLIALALRGRHAADVDFAGVRARNPPNFARIDGFAPERLARLMRQPLDLGTLVSDAELDGKGVPVLLREYLKLGARFVGTNVDPDFHDALDALVIVDLVHTERRRLERYLGEEGAARFLLVHAAREHVDAA